MVVATRDSVHHLFNSLVSGAVGKGSSTGNRAGLQVPG